MSPELAREADSTAVPAPVAPAPRLACTIVANPLQLAPAALYGVARRHNARRSALFVSRVLGKHVPAPPAVVALAGELLAASVAGNPPGPVGRRDLTDGAGARAALARLRSRRRPRGDATVIAFAETATALGHLVRDGLGAPHLLHTTRAILDQAPLLGVEEEHSHATSHRLYHRDPAALAGSGPVVLVDDEVTTGRTMLATIAAVHAIHQHPRYVVATLLDWRDGAARAAFAGAARSLRTRIDVVALVTGSLSGALVDGEPPPEPASPPQLGPAEPATRHRVVLPAPATARFGWRPADQAALDASLPAVAGRIAAAGVGRRGPVLCVGTEELMYVPLRIAEQLAVTVPAPVRYQSTTRSPIVVADVDGYPVRHVTRFAHHEENDRLSRLYNVAPGAYEDLVVFVEGEPSSTIEGLAPMISAMAGLVPRIHLVQLMGASA